MTGLTHVEAWSTITRVFGATAADPVDRRVAHRRGDARRDRPHAGGRAQRRPIARSRRAARASLLTLHLAFVAARACGRRRRRRPRRLRSDPGRRSHAALAALGRTVSPSSPTVARCATHATARRPGIGSSRSRARPSSSPTGRSPRSPGRRGSRWWRSSGLDRPGLAIAAGRAGRCTVVPMRTDRPARAYGCSRQLVARPSSPGSTTRRTILSTGCDLSHTTGVDARQLRAHRRTLVFERLE